MTLWIILALFAIPSILVQIAPANRRRRYSLVFVLSLTLGAAYSFLEEYWPFGVLWSLWALAIFYYGWYRNPTKTDAETRSQ
jgi:hypothetical protein